MLKLRVFVVVKEVFLDMLFAVLVVISQFLLHNNTILLLGRYRQDI